MPTSFFIDITYLNIGYDVRIDFRDLNNVTSLNVLDSSDRDLIWYPRLGFTNALGPVQTQVDDLTIGMLVREDSPLAEDITLAIEGYNTISN